MSRTLQLDATRTELLDQIAVQFTELPERKIHALAMTESRVRELARRVGIMARQARHEIEDTDPPSEHDITLRFAAVEQPPGQLHATFSERDFRLLCDLYRLVVETFDERELYLRSGYHSEEIWELLQKLESILRL